LTTYPVLSLVGFHVKTYEYKLVSFIIFICLFIDTIILPLFNGANLIEYHDRNLLDSVFTGHNTDFGEEWYATIGYQYVTTMTIFTVNPFIDFVIEYIELSIFRCYARRFVYKNDTHLAKYDFLKYLDLKAGPEYGFHTKLANTNLLFFITLIFGPIMPILYPIAVIAVIV